MKPNGNAVAGRSKWPFEYLPKVLGRSEQEAGYFKIILNEITKQLFVVI
jgi:hypothetical protein